MLDTIGISLLITAGVSVSLLTAATVNDGACAAVAGHIPVVRAVEQFLMLCWLV